MKEEEEEEEEERDFIHYRLDQLSISHFDEVGTACRGASSAGAEAAGGQHLIDVGRPREWSAHVEDAPAAAAAHAEAIEPRL